MGDDGKGRTSRPSLKVPLICTMEPFRRRLIRTRSHRVLSNCLVVVSWVEGPALGNF